MPRHRDFQKIYDAFMWRYCKDKKECEEGKRVYYAWLNKLGLDDTKPYQRPQESFDWVKPHIQFMKEDEKAEYFKIEALFPLSSMNNNVYTKEELIRACRTLVGKPTNLNHTETMLPEVQTVDADYEDDIVGCLDRVEKGSKTLQMIKSGEILQVSIEAECLRGTEQTPDGNVCKGQIFTGKAYLTKDVLPGVPLTRIIPVEKLVESFTVTSVTNLNEPNSQNQTPEPKKMCNLCGTCDWTVENPAEKDVVDKCPKCGAPAYYVPILAAEQIRQKRAEQPPQQTLPPSTTPNSEQNPRSDADRAKAHFNISDEDWLKLSEPEKQDLISKLPPRGSGEAEAEWTTAYINDLPNSSFAVIEPAYLDGKTEDKRCRHLPFKDKDGKVDLPHLTNALARMNQIVPVTDSISAADLRAKAQKVLIAAAKDAGVGDYEVLVRQGIFQKVAAEVLEKIKDLQGNYEALKSEVEQLKKPEEQPKQEPKKEPCKCVLTKEGFWARFHQLRSEGLNKTDSFRLVSMEVIEAATKKAK